MRFRMKNEKWQMTNGKSFSVRRTAQTILLAAYCLLLTISAAPAQTTRPQAATTVQAFQNVIARQAALVSEFDINGLKVLVKRREGSQTVATGLFIRGG